MYIFFKILEFLAGILFGWVVAYSIACVILFNRTVRTIIRVINALSGWR